VEEGRKKNSGEIAMRDLGEGRVNREKWPAILDPGEPLGSCTARRRINYGRRIGGMVLAEEFRMGVGEKRIKIGGLKLRGKKEGRGESDWFLRRSFTRGSIKAWDRHYHKGNASLASEESRPKEGGNRPQGRLKRAQSRTPIKSTSFDKSRPFGR